MKVGDVIKVNDIVVEIETAKSLVELPSPFAGTVTELLAAEGTSIEVIDLRSLSPIDYEPILASVQKTGRLVVAQEAPVLRVSGFDTPFPPAKLEGAYLPDADRVLEAVDRSLAY